jgi:hypothetical protein
VDARHKAGHDGLSVKSRQSGPMVAAPLTLTVGGGI